MKRLLIAMLLLAIAAQGQILKLSELNTKQIEALDREKTVIIIPGGIMEEHGPYLPSGTDTLNNEWQAARLAEGLVAAKPGWTVLMFPTVPIGTDGANAIGGHHIFPGTYTVSQATMRELYMDLAAQFGEQRFKWIFLVHNHGAPRQHRALNDAGDFFHDTYGGEMVHLYGVTEVFFCCNQARKQLPVVQTKEDGFTVHAGMSEHSSVLFLRPDLVGDVSHAPSFTGHNDIGDLARIAKEKDWPGYFGAPKYAVANLGAMNSEAQRAKLLEVALKILAGADPRKMERYGDLALNDPQEQSVNAGSESFEQALARKKQAWMTARSKR